MSSREHLGEFEQIVLLAVLRLGENAYGVPVRHEIEKRTKRSLTVGALYRTLDRLEAKGYVASWFGDPVAERGGGRNATFAWNRWERGLFVKARRRWLPCGKASSSRR